MIRPEPSTLTRYWSCRADSTITPDLSHLVGLGSADSAGRLFRLGTGYWGWRGRVFVLAWTLLCGICVCRELPPLLPLLDARGVEAACEGMFLLQFVHPSLVSRMPCDIPGQYTMAWARCSIVEVP